MNTRLYCVQEFQTAANAFVNTPNAASLAFLQERAAWLLRQTPPPPCQDWITIESPDAFRRDWYEIRAIFGRWLTDEEITRAAGALGYALKEVLAGEELSDPDVIRSCRAQQTILLFAYDSTKSRRDDPDADLTFAMAERYIAEGSPLRRTERAGKGTKGTRLVQGIGPVSVQFAVR